MKKHYSDPPACVDCKWCAPMAESHAQCRSDDCSVYHTVTGRQPSEAHAARGQDGPCGLTARFFAPKPEPTWMERNFLTVLMLLVFTAFALYLTDAWRLVLLYGVG